MPPRPIFHRRWFHFTTFSHFPSFRWSSAAWLHATTPVQWAEMSRRYCWCSLISLQCILSTSDGRATSCDFMVLKMKRNCDGKKPLFASLSLKLSIGRSIWYFGILARGSLRTAHGPRSFSRHHHDSTCSSLVRCLCVRFFVESVSKVWG